MQPRVTECSVLDGVLPGRAHLFPCAGPALGAPLPRSRRRAWPPGAAASSWVWETVSRDPRLCPSAPAALAGPCPALPAPSPGLACGSAGSLRQPPPQSRGGHSREKSLILGGGAAGGDPGARLHPPSQRSPPPPPLPWTDDLTPLNVKTPPPMASGNPPEGSLQMLREPLPTSSRVRGLGCFRSNGVISEVTAGSWNFHRFLGTKEAAGWGGVGV